MEITFKKVHTAKDLTISAIIMAAGIGLYFINAGVGIVLAICGLLMPSFSISPTTTTSLPPKWWSSVVKGHKP